MLYKEAGMPSTAIRDKLIENIESLPEKRLKEVIDFIEYLKLKEDDWFIKLVNQRGKAAKTEKKAGKRLTQLKELQNQYQ
jgi:hypothetical protein